MCCYETLQVFVLTEVLRRQGLSTPLWLFFSSMLCSIYGPRYPRPSLFKVKTRTYQPMVLHGQGSTWTCCCSGRWSVCCWCGHITSVWWRWSWSSGCVWDALCRRSGGCHPHISPLYMCGSDRQPSSIRLEFSSAVFSVWPSVSIF